MAARSRSSSNLAAVPAVIPAWRKAMSGRHRPHLVGAAAIALLLGATAPQARAQGCTPQLSVTEQVVGGSPGAVLAQYVLQTGNLCGLEIVALAVDNDQSLAAFANLSGWNAQVVTDDFWDAGIVLSRDDFGTGSSYLITTGPGGIGSFASFFGPVAQLANVYWLSAHFGGPVVDNSTAFTAVGTPIALPEDAFQFQTGALASTVIAFTGTGGSIAVPAVSVVPEPAPAALLALGGLGLLALRGVRRRAAMAG